MIDLTVPEIALMNRVLREAALLARAIQEESAAFNLTKDDRSPVTVADFTIQAVVARRLCDAFPGVVLVAEERAARLREPEQAEMLATIAAYAARVIPGATGSAVCDWIDYGVGEPGDRFWTLDPIDGTKGYRRGGQYATALALIENGMVRCGGLACPVMAADCDATATGGGILALATRGGGAWYTLLDKNSAPFMPLSVSPCAESARARLMRSYESGHTNVEELEAVAARLGIPPDHCVLMDSQAKYACMAAGKAELLFRLLSPSQPDYRECIWDQAAGSLIIEAAGGKVTDLHGRPLDFSQGRKLTNNLGVFASNGPLHDTGLAALEYILTT